MYTASERQAYDKAWYKTNKDRIKERKAVANKAFRARRRALLVAAKAHPCKDCGHTFHHAAMQFDHVRGEKLFILANGMYLRSLEEIEAEMEKCDLVCSNCHAVRTYERAHQ